MDLIRMSAVKLAELIQRDDPLDMRADVKLKFPEIDVDALHDPFQQFKNLLHVRILK